jgi:hypothetical protein
MATIATIVMEMYGRFEDECLTVRGLEAYVPALNAIRVSCWSRLSAEWRCLLEIADYVGLETLVDMTRPQLEDYRSLLPAEVWQFATLLAARAEGAPPSEPAFRAAGGRPYDIGDVIAAVGSALHTRSC